MVSKRFMAIVAACGAAPALAFVPGNIVLMRGGDANSSQSTLGTGEVPAYLDEYSVNVFADHTVSVSSVSSYAIPSNTLTLPGILANSHEGRLNLSGDGQYLTFAGYQQAVGATARRTDGLGGSSYYQVGRVSAGGVYAGSSLDTSVATPQFVRAAYSTNGGQAWVASKNPNGGLEYVSGLGGGSATTTQLQSTTDWRSLNVQNGQLFGGTGSSSVGTHGFYAIGSGAPTTGTPVNTRLSGTSDTSGSGFSFATLPGGTQPIAGAAGGANVVYIVGDPSGNNFLAKMYVDPAASPISTDELLFAGGSRLSIPSVTTPDGVLTRIDPNNSAWVDIFIQSSDGVWFGVDTSGTSTGSLAGMTFTHIISNNADTAFYGIAPSTVPAPAGLLALAGAGLVAGRRRRN